MKTFLIPLFLMAASGFAQTTTTAGAPHQPDPARIVERLTTLLTLTAAQQAQATTIFTNELAAVAPVQTSSRTAHTSLAAAVKANDTAAIDTLSTQLGTYSGQLTAIQSKAQAAFYAILTADQQTKYSSLPGGDFGGGFGGPGGGGRPNFRGR